MDHGLMDFVHSIIDLIKFCFNYHWLLGVFIILLLFALFAYALMFLLLYFIFWAFNTGHYVWGSIGILFLMYSYWQGRQKKQDAETSEESTMYSRTTNTNNEGERGAASFSQAKELPREEREKEKTSQKQQEHRQKNTKAHESAEVDFHYKVLGCNRGDPFSTIQRAYRRLAKEYHPDAFGDKPKEFIELATKKMQEINWAYQQICEERGERR